jgi:triacylglycerol esterase/lipase EstA (alpha/beta hydrolase family)
MDQFEWRVRPLRRAYQRAAEDLGIRVTTDGASLVDDQGERHPLIALVHDFGGGMHVFEEYDKRVADVAWQRGNGFTVLGSGGKDTYDRESFIEALNDWGWTGDGAPPEWYTEQPEDE